MAQAVPDRLGRWIIIIVVAFVYAVAHENIIYKDNVKMIIIAKL